MTYESLPKTLTVGMKIACRKWYEFPEVVEIVKMDAHGKILLMRENGTIVHGIFTQQILINFDYQLVKE